MRILLGVLFTFCCYGLSYAESSDSPPNKLQRVHPVQVERQGLYSVKKHVKKQKIKRNAHTQPMKLRATTQLDSPAVTGQAHPVIPACEAGYEHRLAQADDMVCVSHQAAMRIANENKTATVAGKPNPMTTELNLSCKTPDYAARQATPTDNICVTRSSKALVRAQNHPDN
jgi:hypothetical protein